MSTPRIKRKFKVEIEQNPEPGMKRFSVYLTYRDHNGLPAEKQFHGTSVRSLMKMAGMTVEDDLGLLSGLSFRQHKPAVIADKVG